MADPGSSPMRVAALYDVHGNLPALEAVLEEVAASGADLVVVGGDVVPGPLPRESLAVLRRLPMPTRFIQGNGEADVLALHRGEVPSRVPEPFVETIRWVADRLRPRELEELASWPATTRLPVDGLGDVLFCHATPRDDNELFTRLTPEERLRPILEATGADTVVCGHTHMQFDRQVGDVRVINAGSVGMPFGPRGAYWVLLGPDVELRRTRYDLQDAARRIADSGYPRATEFDPRYPPAEPRMLEAFEAAALGRS